MGTCLVIKKWGNKLGVRLPAVIAHDAKLHADQEVMLTVEHGRVIMELIRTSSDLTLDERLQLFDPAPYTVARVCSVNPLVPNLGDTR